MTTKSTNPHFLGFANIAWLRLAGLLFVATALLLSVAASHADPIILDSGTGGSVLRSTTYGDATALSVGYRFSLSSNQTITAFGLYDAANTLAGFQGDGLISANNEVNLWLFNPNPNQDVNNLLAISAPIPQIGADASGFIYQNSYQTFNGFNGTLLAGTSYIVTARYNTTGGVSGNNIDAFRQNAVAPTPASFTSVESGQFSGTGTFYQFPGNVSQTLVGPNIQVVPEPAALGLLCCGLAALFVLRRVRLVTTK